MTTVRMEALLNSTWPILYDTGSEEWPYAYSGTCFPIKYRHTLFVVSAEHCFRNFKIEPEQLLYPRPCDPTGFFGFDLKTKAHAPHASDEKHADQVVLRVTAKHHSQDEIGQIVALDLSENENALLPTSQRIKDFWLRGFPFDAPRHAIDYDACSIRRQAYVTNGCLGVGKAPFDLCYMIKMMSPIPAGMSPNGMSGTPVYGETRQGRPVYCGTVTRFNEFTREYLCIGPEMLVNCLRDLCDRGSDSENVNGKIASDGDVSK